MEVCNRARQGEEQLPREGIPDLYDPTVASRSEALAVRAPGEACHAEVRLGQAEGVELLTGTHPIHAGRAVAAQGHQLPAVGTPGERVAPRGIERSRWGGSVGLCKE